MLARTRRLHRHLRSLIPRDRRASPGRSSPVTLSHVSSAAGVRLLALVLLGGCAGQRVDGDFVPRVERRTFQRAEAPVACVDQAHNNSHTAAGLYAPLARLLTVDGYRVEALRDRFTRGVATRCDVLVIVNAAGGRTYKVFGLNLPTKSRQRRPLAAFTPVEVDTLLQWIERGGSLLLVADHYPYGSAAASLAGALGVDMSGGFTEAAHADPAGRDRGQLVYSRANRLLADHPITNGGRAEERVERVVTFTGQSLHAAAGTPLLVLGDSAVDFVPPPPTFTPRRATGRAQGIALEIGRGRVVVLAEAAALTAQRDDGGRPFGMQLPDNHNARFALNIMHWLSRRL